MNSKTRYSLLSAWTMSSSLLRFEGSRDAVDAVEPAADIVVPHNVIILEFLQETDFSNGSARDTFIFCFQSNLLEGDDFV